MQDGEQLPRLRYKPDREQEKRVSAYHRVPSFSVDAPEHHAEYPDWTPENTRVISVGIGEDGKKYPNHFNAPSPTVGKQMVEEKYGRIVETNSCRGRMFCRVYKVKP